MVELRYVVVEDMQGDRTLPILMYRNYEEDEDGCKIILTNWEVVGEVTKMDWEDIYSD